MWPECRARLNGMRRQKKKKGKKLIQQQSLEESWNAFAALVIAAVWFLLQARRTICGCIFYPEPISFFFLFFFFFFLSFFFFFFLSVAMASVRCYFVGGGGQAWVLVSVFFYWNVRSLIKNTMEWLTCSKLGFGEWGDRPCGPSGFFFPPCISVLRSCVFFLALSLCWRSPLGNRHYFLSVCG